MFAVVYDHACRRDQSAESAAVAQVPIAVPPPLELAGHVHILTVCRYITAVIVPQYPSLNHKKLGRQRFGATI